MCGIVGFNWQDTNLVKAMNKSIKHRGPDDEGTFIDKNISFGHVRLSIIELSKKGHQPMGIDSKNLQIYKDSELENANIVIIFNGEIYNYKDIKNEIGGRFYSESDTEVILRAYKKWGFDCVKKFNGMWSFCIYDKKKQILFCSRDRLGVKPFYYYFNGQEFIFSSELKGILQIKKLNKKENIDKEAINLYFSLGYIPSPHTIYKNTYKLEGSHNLIFDLQKKTIKKIKYYELPNYKPTYNKKELVDEGRKILFDATKIRMISDVPVGAFLSGGLDSSAVVGAMSKNTELKNLHTFSIGFEQKYDDGRYDETKYINIVKDYFKTKHHHYYFKEKDFENILEKYSTIYDEPFADYSGFPTYKISEIARKNVTVVLSGDGGDEIFGGYSSHKMGARMELIRKTPKLLRRLISKLPVKKNLNSTTSLYLLKEALKLSLIKKENFHSESLIKDSIKSVKYKKWSSEKLKYSLKKGNNNLAESLRIYDLLFNTLQDNFLVKVDRASMHAPIEVRSPFLDYRFVDFAQKIPTKWKTNCTTTKILMREIIKDIVPKEIINRGKQGFEPPLDKWINSKKYEDYVKTHITILKSMSPLIYATYEKRILKENNKLNSIYKIRLFLFLKWWNTWIN
ncbi:MAG: asparagine synthase (glutamine-hydrolyzing) [Candidatus Woesearchaeota archaeon]|jgi:asparagine synthase (glutamine-hydrolysing)